MTETLARSTEQNAQKIHDDYRNILRFFVAVAQLESDPEVAIIKSAPGKIKSSAGMAIEISKVRTRARVRILADAIYATKHFRSKVEQKIHGHPDSLETKAYQGLVDARVRGDFDQTPDDPRITRTLQQVPEHAIAERNARLALRRDGEAPRDRVQSYRAAAYILTVLPTLPAPRPEQSPLASEARSIPRQSVPLAVDALA